MKVSSQPQRPIPAPRRNRLSTQPRPVPAPRRPQLQHISHRTNQRFRSYIDEYRVLIEFVDLVSIFLRAFELAIEANGLVNGDRIRLIVNHPNWQNPLSTRILTINGMISEDLVEDIARWVEYRVVPLTELEITIESFAIPRGTGRLTATTNNLKSKKSLITIKNDDSMCLSRAIVTAMANINKDQWSKTQLQDGFNRSRKL